MGLVFLKKIQQIQKRYLIVDFLRKVTLGHSTNSVWNDGVGVFFRNESSKTEFSRAK